MIIATLFLFVIIAVVGIYFYAEIVAIVNDYQSILIQKILDEDIKVPAPQAGQRVCDLTITIDVRSESALSGTGISTERILFTDGKAGKQIGWNWNNCHEYKSSLLSASLLDAILSSDLKKLEFFFPSADPFDQKIILSYSLVDENGLRKKLPHHQNILYIHPSFQNTFDFNQQLKFFQLIPQEYILEILPLEAHFEDKKVGDRLSKSITFTE